MKSTSATSFGKLLRAAADAIGARVPRSMGRQASAVRPLRVHYQNPLLEEQYLELHLWAWEGWTQEQDIPCLEVDDFGPVFAVPPVALPKAHRVGLKFKQGPGMGGTWYEFDRFYYPSRDPSEVWIRSGDPSLYGDPSGPFLPHVEAAWWDGPASVRLLLSEPIRGSRDPRRYHLEPAGHVLSVRGEGRHLELITSRLDIQTAYTVVFETGRGEIKQELMPRRVLDSFVTEEPLGTGIDGRGNTWFRVWAPRARSVTLQLASSPHWVPNETLGEGPSEGRDDGKGHEIGGGQGERDGGGNGGGQGERDGGGQSERDGGGQSERDGGGNGGGQSERDGGEEGRAERRLEPLRRHPRTGVWSTVLKGNLHGTHYWYMVEGPQGVGEAFDSSRPLNDPYALIAASSFGAVAGAGMVVDRARLKPPQPLARRPLSELVAYELHVRDLTGHATSGLSPEDPGHRRFLGFTRAGTRGPLIDDPSVPEAKGLPVKTGLDHLEELGITAVQLLPVQESPSDPSRFDWGYLTANFFSPEGSYATRDHDLSKILEFQALVEALHARGIAVILDVVFNHTAEGDEAGPLLNFKGFDAKYYYRQDPRTFVFSNGSGVGNDFASERPMARRFILDCLHHWVETFGVDGFRFDLAGLLDLGTIAAIGRAFPDLYLYGEPWAASGALWGKGAINRIEPWCVFNDDFRNAIKGSPEGSEGGFIQGAGVKERVKTAITGSAISWGAPSWADSPLDSLLYLDAHDNLTLADKLEVSVGAMSTEEKEARVRLAATVLLTSLGPVMLHAGVDFLRTKPYYAEGDGRPVRGRDSGEVFDANSYCSSDATNNLDWSLKARHYGVFKYVQGLIQLRLGPLGQPCRPSGPVQPTYFQWHEDPHNYHALGYTLNADGSNGPGRLRVFLNASSSRSACFEGDFEDGCWYMVADGTRVELGGRMAAEGASVRQVKPLGICIFADGMSGVGQADSRTTD